jgi:hypothetical protein
VEGLSTVIAEVIVNVPGDPFWQPLLATVVGGAIVVAADALRHRAERRRNDELDVRESARSIQDLAVLITGEVAEWLAHEPDAGEAERLHRVGVSSLKLQVLSWRTRSDEVEKWATSFNVRITALMAIRDGSGGSLNDAVDGIHEALSEVARAAERAARSDRD